jgi:hypothetical protein
MPGKEIKEFYKPAMFGFLTHTSQQGLHGRQDRQDLDLAWILQNRPWLWRHAGNMATTMAVLSSKNLQW